MRDAALALEHPDPVELADPDPEVLEQRPTAAQEDRDEVDLELVEKPCAQRALGGGGAVDQDRRVAGGLTGRRERRLEVFVVVDERPVGGPGGRGRRDNTWMGTPAWWSPPQPPAGSNVPRPATIAPVDRNSPSTMLFTRVVGSSNGHSCRRTPPSPRPLSSVSFGPAMNPSSDMDMSRTVVLMAGRSPLVCGLA